jgi:dTMP kinase
MSNRQDNKGRFIAVEGVDGAGKGVQCAYLLQALGAAGVEAILTREPGGSPGAEQIRELVVNGATDKWDAMTELLLIYAARRSHLQQTILPAVARGTWVISDRFADSSRAFQGIAGGLGLETVEALHRLVVGDFRPDLTIVLDLEPEASLARTRQRGGGEDRFEKKGVEYQNRVRCGFRELALASPSTHVLIDASGSREDVRKLVLEAVSGHLGLELQV